jgi:hypothetical protein
VRLVDDEPLGIPKADIKCEFRYLDRWEVEGNYLSTYDTRCLLNHRKNLVMRHGHGLVRQKRRETAEMRTFKDTWYRGKEILNSWLTLRSIIWMKRWKEYSLR